MNEKTKKIIAHVLTGGVFLVPKAINGIIARAKEPTVYTEADLLKMGITLSPVNRTEVN